MPVIGRLGLLVYSLMMLVIAVVVVAVSLEWVDPVSYYNMAVATPGNKLVMVTVGIIVGIVSLAMLVWSIRPSSSTNAVQVEKGLSGEVSISIAAIKVIIMKAVKQVEGVKDIKSVVRNTSGGLMVKLHIMINPEQTVPEMAQSLQVAVRDHLEKIGGLQVAEIKVLVDDFNVVSK